MLIGLISQHACCDDMRHLHNSFNQNISNYLCAFRDQTEMVSLKCVFRYFYSALLHKLMQ